MKFNLFGFQISFELVPASIGERERKIAELREQHYQAGERRDSQECSRLEAELYRLTGDPYWGPLEDEG